MTFAERLVLARKERKISQRTLAERVGVNHTYISKIEGGLLAPPSDETIEKMAQVLEVPPDELLIAAGRIPSDLRPILTRSATVPAFVRRLSGLSDGALEELARHAEQLRAAS